MVGLKKLGIWNISFYGTDLYDGLELERVDIQKFDNLDEPVGEAKTLYFVHDKQYAFAQEIFTTSEITEEYYEKYENNSKLAVRRGFDAEIIHDKRQRTGQEESDLEEDLEER